MSSSASPATAPPTYPATLAIDYPEKADRLTSFFRIFTVIPIIIVLGLITGGSWEWSSHGTEEGWRIAITTGSSLFLPLVLMILFRKKYPKWWYDWSLALARFGYRVGAYFLLLRHEYPSTDAEQAVHVNMAYPDAEKDLQRGMPLVKWFLAIPHLFVLAFLAIAVFVVSVIAWFAILFTGHYPRGLFDFSVGVLRWGFRVEAYAFLLITDKYPKFSTEP